MGTSLQLLKKLTLTCIVKLVRFWAPSVISLCVKDAVGFVKLLNCDGQQAVSRGIGVPGKMD